ncbi:hypothetical protein [Stenotrophomonas phage CM2]
MEADRISVSRRKHESSTRSTRNLTGDSILAKVTIRHEDGATTSLTGAHGVRRYEAVGYIIVQLFAPSGGCQYQVV